MLAETLQGLINRRLTTVREVVQLTGKTDSTVYRWLARQSEPSFSDVQKLVAGLRHVEARRAIMTPLTSGLPVTVDWLAPAEGEVRAAAPATSEDAVKTVIQATRAVNESLSEVFALSRGSSITPQARARCVQVLEQAIRHLIAVRRFLSQEPSIAATPAPASLPVQGDAGAANARGGSGGQGHPGHPGSRRRSGGR